MNMYISVSAAFFIMVQIQYRYTKTSQYNIMVFPITDPIIGATLTHTPYCPELDGGQTMT